MCSDGFWKGISIMMNDFSSIISRASKGDPEAMMVILGMYKPLIDRDSRVRGHIDEDLRQYIIFKLLLAVPKFTL